jgi:NADH dehydrogenase
MLSEGATMTMRLPLRGTIQVRVVELTEREVTCVTVEGHPLAGAVRFLAEQRGDAVRFEVQTYDRAATTADRIALATIATSLKHSTWQTTVERVVERSGGTAPDGVEMEEEKLDDAQAAEIERWVEGLVMATKREG